MSDAATNTDQLAKELAEAKGLSLSDEQVAALSAILSGGEASPVTEDGEKRAAHHGAPALPPARKRAKKKGVKEKNPRKGKMGKDGVFEGGKPPAVPNFDPGEIAEKLDMYWVDGDGDKFQLRNPEGDWSTWTKAMVNKKMRAIPGRMITLRPRDGEANSEADRVLLHTMENRRVNRMLDQFAGYAPGVYSMKSNRVLVKGGGKQILPEEGDWSYTRKFLEERMGEEPLRFLYSWLQVSYRSRFECVPGEWAPGQALIFCGAADSSKSRIQHQIITPLLGWRSADPGSYMFGTCDFNDEMIAAEHILMEDPRSTTNLKDRVYFGEMIKAMVVNDESRLHPKGKGALTGTPFWRLTISVNDDPDKMRVLPPITPDIEDKIMIFRVKSVPHEIPAEHLDGRPVADDILERRLAFREKIYSELPAFLWWLLNDWKIPEDIRGERFGVKHYHETAVLEDLFEDTQQSQLLHLIDEAEFSSSEGDFSKRKLWELEKGELNHSKKETIWHGSALQLEQLLTGEIVGVECSVENKAKQFFRHNATKNLLPRLRADGKRVDRKNTAQWKGWIISCPPKVKPSSV